jgi:hypothetical protein
LPWDIITEKKTKETNKFIRMLKVAFQFVNKVSHDAVRGALKWFISLCERKSNSEDTGILINVLWNTNRRLE